MFATIIEWHNATEELPAKSGEYIVHTAKSRFIAQLPYSKKNKAFNSYDDEKRADNAIDVLYWANVPEFPDNESEAE